MKMKTLQDCWVFFSNQVIPEHASPIQHSEMRKAFYGGAAAMFDLVTSVGTTGGDEDSQVGEIEAFHQELQVFAATLV